jgi:hypothetical protein
MVLCHVNKPDSLWQAGQGMVKQATPLSSVPTISNGWWGGGQGGVVLT